MEDKIIKYKSELKKYTHRSKTLIDEDEKKFCERMVAKLKADIYVEEYKLSKLNKEMNK